MFQQSDIQIALADDHLVVRKGLAGLLNCIEGLKVVIDADNGRQLLDQLDTATIIPQVCILDINMPVMNGYETARALQKSYPEINILALSMYDSELNIINMLLAGAQGYLLKNAQPSELSLAIHHVVEHGFYHSEIITDQIRKVIKQRRKGPSLLNENEERFLAFCCSELSYREIADKMFKSARTIDGYREDLFQKLGISSRTGLVMYAIKSGITSA